ncbi:GNAT family N-acetyltransferase [Alicyclobacillus sp. ALC3]|uniref:GNAT family N-acetyltransferase n=1 Tax=Alicyclobacillus sp. ALC3 TaxID=2796143 RepID=UPI002378858A|nr:GNAT family N-acetyltransferase [Alicyclobacillus sp. ALC3]
MMNEYLSFEGLPEPGCWNGLCRLHDSIFTGQGSSTLSQELKKRSCCLVQVAMAADVVVGYKIGYEDRTHRFYSWLGGVDPAFRGRGIASELMRRQHEWCRDHGYHAIRTHTKNKWRDMLILNIRHGFDVIGTYTDGKGESKIILEKRLG